MWPGTLFPNSSGNTQVWPGTLFPNSSGNKAAANLRFITFTIQHTLGKSSPGWQSLEDIEYYGLSPVRTLPLPPIAFAWVGRLCATRPKSTFPIENVKLIRTITPVGLFVSDHKFSEQLQWLKKSLKLNLSVTFFLERNELSMNLRENFGKFWFLFF